MPALPVELHEQAIQEATAARLWYAARSVRAAAAFGEELGHAVANI